MLSIMSTNRSSHSGYGLKGIGVVDNSKKNILVSAPGKIILHGEHAVVYGKKALAVSLNIRTLLELREQNDNTVTIDLPDIDIHASWSLTELRELLPDNLCMAETPIYADSELISKLKDIARVKSDDDDIKNLSLVSFLYLYASIAPCKEQLPSITVHVESQLPAGAGLGSSAAYGTCLASSLLLFHKVVTQVLCQCNSEQKTQNAPKHHRKNCTSLRYLFKDKKEEDDHWLSLYDGEICDGCVWSSQEDLNLINLWALQSEIIMHGKPSGIDNSIATYGNALTFHNGRFSSLQRLPELDILLTNSKIPRSTKHIVSIVRERYKKFPNVIEPILSSIESITIQAEALLKQPAFSDDDELIAHLFSEEDFSKLETLIEINQSLLCSIGASHPCIDEIVLLTSEKGYKTKLTGAGGGGCTLTLLPSRKSSEDISELMDSLSNKGYESWCSSIGGKGVVQHHYF